jgi:hypothetical protein
MKSLSLAGILVAIGFLPLASSATEPNVRVWGTNTYHQLEVPPDLTNAVAVSVGYGHVLALREGGTVVVSWTVPNADTYDRAPSRTLKSVIPSPRTAVPSMRHLKHGWFT